MYENTVNKESVPMRSRFQDIIQKVTSEMEGLSIQEQIEIAGQLKRFVLNQIEQKGGYHREQVKVHEEYMNTAKSI